MPWEPRRYEVEQEAARRRQAALRFELEEQRRNAGDAAAAMGHELLSEWQHQVRGVAHGD